MTKTSLKSFYDLVHYTDEDGYEYFLPHDYVGEGIKTIDRQEHAIHKGQVFAAWGDKASVAVDGAYDIVIRTPAGSTAYTHILKEHAWANGNQCRLQIFETPTTATSDTSFTPINRNRLSTGVSAVGIETSATVTVGAATEITEHIYAGGTIEDKIVLNTSTVYVFRAINKHTDSATMSMKIEWSEEDRGLET